jgi:hypothetical protein
VEGALGSTTVRAVAAGRGLLAAATYDSVYVSRDEGASWRKLDGPEVSVGPVTGLVIGDEALFVLTQRLGVFDVR